MTTNDPRHQPGQPAPDSRPTQAYSAVAQQASAHPNQHPNPTAVFAAGDDDFDAPVSRAHNDPSLGRPYVGDPPAQTYVTQEELDRMELAKTESELDSTRQALAAQTQQSGSWKTRTFVTAAAAVIFGLLLVWALVTRGEEQTSRPVAPGGTATSMVVATSTDVQTSTATTTATETATRTHTETEKTTTTDTATVTVTSTATAQAPTQ